MARTFINPSTQIGNSTEYKDDLNPGSGLQNVETLQDDLNALRTMLKAAVGKNSWYEAPTSTLETVNTGLGTAQGDISALQTDLGTAQGDISTLQSDVSTAQGNISSLQTDLGTAQSNISTLQTDLGTAQGDIAVLQGSVATLTTEQGNLGITVAQNVADIVQLGNDIVGEAALREQADSTLDGRLTTAEGEIDTLQSDLSTAQSNISTLQTDLDAAELSITSLQGDVSTLQSDVSALDAAVIKKDGSVAFTGNQSLGNNLLTDLGTPVSALDAANKAYVDAVATGLVIKAPVAAKYDFQGGEQPDVPTLPTEPPTTFLYTGTTYTVTDEGGLNNALGVAIDGDSIFIPANTTITLTSSKTISRSIQLYGVDSSSVLTASFAVSANSGLLIVAGKKSDNSQNNNVAIRKLAITSSSNTNDHACIVANTLSAEFPNGSTGLRFESLTLNHTEFGITVAADSWKIKNCTFNYIPVTGASDTSRHLGIYNIGTMGWVEDCSFPATTEATPRTIAMLLSAANYVFTPGAEQSGGYSGDFVVKNCSQTSGNLRQWMVMEVFKANGLNSAPMAEHGFSMWLINNEHGNTSGGSHILYDASGKAPLDFFDVIYTSSNQIGATTGGAKGMFALDGIVSVQPRSGGAPNHLYTSTGIVNGEGTANVGGEFMQPMRAGYVNGARDSQDPANGVNTIGVNTAVFSSPSTVPDNPIEIEEPSTGGVLVPAGTGVDVGGYTAQAGDRIFVVNSYDAVQSGIYIAAAGDWARSDDYAAVTDVASTFFFVKQGNYADTSWVEISDPAVVGTNPLNYAQFSGPGTYTGTGAINVSAQNVISVVSGGIVEAMLASSSVTEDKLAADSVSTLKIADSAVTTAKLGDLAVTTAKIADAAVTAEKLAFEVYTKSESNDLIAAKLSLTGGTMSGDIAMGGSAITGLAAPTNDQDAATKAYVDSSVPAGTRATRTYAEVTAAVAANGLLVGGPNGNLDAPLDPLPADLAAAKHVDIYFNGQLLRPGAGLDVVRDTTIAEALRLTFAATAGDTLCVVAYTS